MRKVSGGSRLSSAMTRGLYLKLRASMAAFNSAMPNSTGPARATPAQSSRLIHTGPSCRLVHDRMPTSLRKIAIQDRKSHRAHGQQTQAGQKLMQQQLARAE